MDFHVESMVEKSIVSKADSLIGNKDANLNTIYKLSLLEEVGLLDEYQKQRVIEQIRKSTDIERKYINEEYHLTMDSDGNLISINDINAREEGEKDTENIIPESRPSEE